MLKYIYCDPFKKTVFWDERSVGNLVPIVCVKWRIFEPLSYHIEMDELNVLKLETPDASYQQSRPTRDDGLILGLIVLYGCLTTGTCVGSYQNFKSGMVESDEMTFVRRV